MRRPASSVSPDHSLISFWYDTYAPELVRHAQMMLADPAAGEDAVADTFLRVWLYLSGGGCVLRPRAFLHRVLNNRVIDEYRRRKSLSLDQLLEQGNTPAVDDTDRIIASFDGRTALELIERLPPLYRDALRLRYGRNLSLEEMSRLCRESKNTLGVRVHRGLHKLRGLYNPVRTSRSTHYAPVP